MPKKITIPEAEHYDQEQNLFFTTKECTLTLEHSLVSLSKWESIYHKPFISNEQKTVSEWRDYIKCMTITQNVDPKIYDAIPISVINEVLEYIDEPMTATWFKNTNQPSSRRVTTAELLYYYMIAQNIPFECQKWHLNRLITLLRVCGEENAPPKKMGRNAMLNQRQMLNEARRAKLHSRG